MKTTAVYWLIKEYSKYIGDIDVPIEVLKKANEMEKEQMLNAFEESRLTHPMIGFKHETFEDYYNETVYTNEK
jgi:hypothetical protein